MPKITANIGSGPHSRVSVRPPMFHLDGQFGGTLRHRAPSQLFAVAGVVAALALIGTGVTALKGSVLGFNGWPTSPHARTEPLQLPSTPLPASGTTVSTRGGNGGNGGTGDGLTVTAPGATLGGLAGAGAAGGVAVTPTTGVPGPGATPGVPGPGGNINGGRAVGVPGNQPGTGIGTGNFNTNDVDS